jgi:CubicO group peptidase (beta-lactamase class C family)
MPRHEHRNVTDPLGAVSSWPAVAAAGWVKDSRQGTIGPCDRVFSWASVTKILTSVATWIAVEEGIASWDDPAGPPGATLAHLLSHSSGVAPDSDDVLAAPGTRRIYSNRGFELVAAHLESRAGMSFADYLHGGVIEPLGLAATTLAGSPASGVSGPLCDLLALGRELLNPTFVSRETIALATTVAFAGLPGVLPGFGRQHDNDWGLGVEIRNGKVPHWTGSLNSARTFGHFGRSGSFLWVDPVLGLMLASLSDREFGPWAAQAWPALSDALIQTLFP